MSVITTEQWERIARDLRRRAHIASLLKLIAKRAEPNTPEAFYWHERFGS